MIGVSETSEKATVLKCDATWDIVRETSAGHNAWLHIEKLEEERGARGELQISGHGNWVESSAVTREGTHRRCKSEQEDFNDELSFGLIESEMSQD